MPNWQTSLCVLPRAAPCVQRRSHFTPFPVPLPAGASFSFSPSPGHAAIIHPSHGRNTISRATPTQWPQSLGPEAGDLFAVWVVSGSLQLQMKPHHMPFKIMKKWTELLHQYTVHGRSEVPSLYFKREVMVTKDMELATADAAARHMFYTELKFNLLYSL